MSIHPQIIEKEGRKEFVVLPYDEFIELQNELEDYHDLKILRQEKLISIDQTTKSLDQVLREIQGDSPQLSSDQ